MGRYGADTKGKLSPGSQASSGSGGQRGRTCRSRHTCVLREGQEGGVGQWEHSHHQEPGLDEVGTRLDLPAGASHNSSVSLTSSSRAISTPPQSIQLLTRRVQILKISLKTCNTGRNQPQQQPPNTPHIISQTSKAPQPTANGVLPPDHVYVYTQREHQSHNFWCCSTLTDSLFQHPSPERILTTF